MKTEPETETGKSGQNSQCGVFSGGVDKSFIEKKFSESWHKRLRGVEEICLFRGSSFLLPAWYSAPLHRRIMMYMSKEIFKNVLLLGAL